GCDALMVVITLAKEALIVIAESSARRPRRPVFARHGLRLSPQCFSSLVSRGRCAGRERAGPARLGRATRQPTSTTGGALGCYHGLDCAPIDRRRNRAL